MNWFYQPDLPLGKHTLEEDEYRHCIKSLRKREGDTIHLIDGKGTYYEGILRSIGAASCSFEIERQYREHPRAYSVHLALAPTKHTDRIEWLVEKLVEVGIDQITFLLCENSERPRLKLERIHKIAVSAMKQSGRATLPVINEVTPFVEFVKEAEADGKFLAHADPNQPIHLLALTPKNKSILVVIGPEGDFAPDEIQLAKENNFIIASLGDYRLRTETAAMVACQSVHHANVGS